MSSPHHRRQPQATAHLPGQRVLQRPPRHLVLHARPVRLQWANPEAGADPTNDWMHADVLNISTGGLCLALPPHLPHQVERLTRLDLRHLGGFGQQPLPVSVQWTLDHNWIATVGIAFTQSLEAIPTINGTLLLQD